MIFQISLLNFKFLSENSVAKFLEFFKEKIIVKSEFLLRNKSFYISML